MPEINIKVKVEIDRIDDILSAFTGLTSVLSSLNAVAPAAVEEAPKKRTRKAKEAPVEEAPVVAEPVVEEAPVVAEATKEEPPFETAKADPVEEEQVVTKEAIQHACIDAAKRVGKEKTMAAIKSLGFNGLSQVPEDKYRELYVALQGLN